MRIAYNLKRAGEIARGLATLRRLVSHDRWSRAQLEAFQRRELSSLVRHAVQNSRFYREAYGALRDPAAARLSELPVVTKTELMDRFDDWVCDPRLRLADLEAHVTRLRRDEHYLGEYRVITTAGSTGQRGVFVFNRSEWSTAVAATLRVGSLIGVAPRLPRRVKVASIGAASPLHATHRVALSGDVGLYKILREKATAPLDTLVAALNDFGPDWLQSYPSIAALLAEEQLAGRLRIAPRAVSTAAEVLTADMRESMRTAWGIEPFNHYGTTEVGSTGVECSAHRGIHVFEDLAIVEVVDEDGRPVPDGREGRKLLITNLYNHTQPLIRYEIDDLVTVSADPCPCGRPLRLLSALQGRSDDVLSLPDGRGGEVPVHPHLFRSVLGATSEIRQYQVVQRPQEILLRLVPVPDTSRDEVAARIQAACRRSLREAGAEPPDIRCEFLSALERDPQMGKLKPVLSDAG